MGVYYTCDECGKTTKGCWPCDCPEKEIDRLTKLRIGSTILDAFQYQNVSGKSLWEKLRRATGEILCTITWLNGSDSTCLSEWWLVETPEADFDKTKLELSALAANSDDSEDSDEQRYKITGQAIQDGFRFRIYEAEFIYDHEVQEKSIEVDKRMMETLRVDIERQGFKLMPRSGVIIEEWFQPGDFYLKTVDTGTAIQFEHFSENGMLYVEEPDDLFKVYSEKALEEVAIDYRKFGWTEFRNENLVKWDKPTNESKIGGVKEPTMSKNALKKKRQRYNRWLKKRQHENEQTRGRMAISHCQVLVPQCQTRVTSSEQVCTRNVRADDQLCRVHSKK
jgi:hypothetical protein